MRVCVEPGCATLTSATRCPAHARVSARNHRGVVRGRREHGAAYDALAREYAGQPCAMRLPGCTGIATGADLIVPFSRRGRATRENTRPGCAHCQRAQGAALTRAG